ncbi:MAG: hypothetical protein KZQ99_00710 [Candidatus Thiodiazotropha sp. (ex Dulcina madagascariensis)]|nr:hypothetical protein [Candidatus Thiodiazotropha sp. (ex Dulcina madagascariensis)]
MINEHQGYKNRVVTLFFMLALFFISTAVNAAQFSLSVADGDGNPVDGFRWLMQQDTTFPVDPNNPATHPDDLLSLDFHRSFHPVGKNQANAEGLSGNTDGSSVNITSVPPGRYYVSVLPYSGHSISGGSVTVLPNAQDPDQTLDNLTVTVQAHPIPTAQISIYLFHDNHPINGVPDLPEEANDGSVDWTKFSLFLEEPAGRYGANGGQLIQDAFGNPLGTEYDQTCDVNGNPTGGFIDRYCFEPDGAPTILNLGDGTMHPDINGFLNVKNLAPGKYGVIIIPPAPLEAEISGWQQTSTIEGSKVIDAWVKANESPLFVEFGLPGPHVFMGFVKSSADGGFGAMPPPDAGEQVATVSGTVTDMHMSRSPTFQFFSGRNFPQCWIGINQINAGGALGQGIYAGPCDGDSNFSVSNVPPGSYQLAVWDANLDVVFAAMPFTVDPTGGTCNGGASCSFDSVPVFNWFARLNTGIFFDDNQNGFWDGNENGIGPESQDVTLRWRDGTVYQNFPTDGEGLAPFDEIFPFFHWLVAEVSFANKKATGATFVVDAGGEVDTAATGFSSYGEMAPQPQVCTAAQSLNPDDAAFGCVVGDDLINPNTPGSNLSRTETGPVLTQAFQGFLGQTSVMHFGKTDYINFTDPDFTAFPPQLPQYVGENGGISGIVFYATTRAEDDPEFAAAETWEPGVPRVQLALYADGDIDCFPQGDFPASDCDIDWNGNGALEADDGAIDDVNRNGTPEELADVDNYPFGWSDAACVNSPAIPGNECLVGNEDVDHNGNDQFELGDALQVTWTDSWDDSLPSGCQGQNLIDLDNDGAVSEAENSRCFDGLRNFNQIRPGVFDGGFAFENYDLTHIPADIAADLTSFYAQRIATVGTTADGIQRLPDEWLLPGDYIVETATPPGYELLEEQHKNVDFGDEYTPSLQAFPASCVGAPHLVPQYLSMVTKDGSGADPGDGSNLVDTALLNDDSVYAPFANETRPSCDRKQVPLSAGQNAAAEFFLMTHVPKAGNVSGMILNDLANEFNPNSPAFGEKFAPPHVPVGFYDWNGNQVNRVYADKFGRYNLMVPSTFTANLPIPSGMSPNMLVSCMNDAGPVQNPAYQAALDSDSDGIDDNGQSKMIVDPFFDSQYSQFCYTFQYMPGTITYLDTPVVPIAAFAGPGQFPVDCERPSATPMIASVKRPGSLIGPFALPGQVIEINAMGDSVQVPNPEWDGIDLADKTITRDYSFSANAEAWIEDANGVRSQLTRLVDSDSNRIVAEVPLGVAAGEYQLLVVNADTDGAESPIGVTLTVGVDDNGTEKGVRPNGQFFNVWSVPGDFDSIQEAIGNPLLGQDGVAPGDLILVAPGIYEEMVIMWKPVRLQGWGAGAVTLNARQSPTEKIANWRKLAEHLVDNSLVDLLPGQEFAPFGFPVQGALGAAVFPTEEGAGIFVAGKRRGLNRFARLRNRGARIDGFTIIGASTGGGIVANGYNQYLNISNNRVTANAGFFGGGIRLGHSQLTHTIANERDPSYVDGDDNRQVDTLVYDDAFNDRINIHHNHIVKNGGLFGNGGGISLHAGADAYRVKKNLICGNFTTGNGGGIAHLGLSRGGWIEDNQIIFNESFSQTPGSAPAGGGVFVGGQLALTPEAETDLMLSPGSGTVIIDANLIHGNLAGAGDGGGIRVASVNGQDIGQNPDKRGRWYNVQIYNNMIDNNVAGVAGGGISLSDAARVFIRNNTVANNDATATGSQAFAPNSPNQSTAQPAGIVSRTHSGVMAQLLNLDEDNGEVFVDEDVFGNRPQGSIFSDPVLRDTIVYHNRSFFWTNYDDPATPVIENGLVPATCLTPIDPLNDPTCDVAQVDVDDYSSDLAVLNGIVVTGDLLNPRRSLLLAGTPYHSSNTFITGDPGFVNGYFNTSRESTLVFPEFKVLQTAGAFDEGGNFLQVAYGPLTLVEPGTAGASLFDYHLDALSPAVDAGGTTPLSGRLSVDIDDDPRPRPTGASDIGADEVVAP